MSGHGRIRRGTGNGLLVIGLCVSLCAPVAARAGTVSVSGTTITFTGAGGEINSLAATPGGAGGIDFSDMSVGSVTAGPGCTQTGAIANCTVVGATLVVDLGDGDDTFRGASVLESTTVDGGSGTDILNTGSGADTLRGGPGDDDLSDGGGADVLDGGTGDDDFAVGTGPDSIVGGASTFGDAVSYEARVNSVNVSLDGVANDGEAGEGDNVATDIEALIGGQGADTLTGSERADSLGGRAGNDTMNGLGGDDDFAGEGGDDVVNGGDGDDTEIPLFSGQADGNDVFNGGPGNDEVFAGVGADTVSGGPGLDRYSTAFLIEAVSIVLDGVANDGRAGEGSNILPDVEEILTGSGNDTVVGGPGANRIDTGSGNDVVRGGGGPDVLNDGLGDDQLFGDDGDDVLDGSFGADRVAGGAGQDTVTYATRNAPLTIIIGGAEPAGEAGEGDTVAGDIEAVIGGHAADRLVGNSSDNLLVGGPGADVLLGGRGNDELDGGRGADVLTGGRGTDTIVGGAGPDRIAARDGARDDVQCGGGRDRVVNADRRGPRRDMTAVDCEAGRVR